MIRVAVLLSVVTVQSAVASPGGPAVTLTGFRAPDSIRVWLVSDGRMSVLKTFRGVADAEIRVAPSGSGLAVLDNRSQVLRRTKVAVASVVAGASKVTTQRRGVTAPQRRSGSARA